MKKKTAKASRLSFQTTTTHLFVGIGRVGPKSDSIELDFEVKVPEQVCNVYSPYRSRATQFSEILQVDVLHPVGVHYHKHASETTVPVIRLPDVRNCEQKKQTRRKERKESKLVSSILRRRKIENKIFLLLLLLLLLLLFLSKRLDSVLPFLWQARLSTWCTFRELTSSNAVAVLLVIARFSWREGAGTDPFVTLFPWRLLPFLFLSLSLSLSLCWFLFLKATRNGSSPSFLISDLREKD